MPQEDIKGDVVIPYGVTSIGRYAFHNCKGLTSVTIGNNVTSIGQKAFYNCSNLIHLTIDKPIEQVKAMKNYPFGIKDESIIECI